MIISVMGTGDSNFAAIIDANDNSLVGMRREGAMVLYPVTASDWRDNTTYVYNKSVNLFGELANAGTEDMFLYKDCDGNFHAFFHNRDPRGIMTLCGGHAYSTDGGVSWVYTGWTYSNVVLFSDGSQITFERRERPHLIFDPNDGCTPVALTNAAEYGGATADASYTLVQPIQT